MKYAFIDFFVDMILLIWNIENVKVELQVLKKKKLNENKACEKVEDSSFGYLQHLSLVCLLKLPLR